MYLLVDIGNTLVKAAVVEDRKVVALRRREHMSVADIREIEAACPGLRGAAVCSVREENAALAGYLRERYREFLDISSATPMPLAIGYDTPGTLGADRLMAAVGARCFERGKKILVVDFGSAVTIDVVSAEGVFLGGNISPGAGLRFRSLNLFTKKLPLCNLTPEISLFGKDTGSAIVNGVVNGILYEISGYIRQLECGKEPFSVFFTGGDGKYFADKLKRTIFVESNLALIGMYEVLVYNYGGK